MASVTSAGPIEGGVPNDSPTGAAAQLSSGAPLGVRCLSCGARIPNAAACDARTVTCPRCGALSLQPTPTAQEHGFEERSVTCLPFELSHVVKAEAVDGWELHDTAVSKSSARMIEARFRRPARPAPSAPVSSERTTRLTAGPARARSAPERRAARSAARSRHWGKRQARKPVSDKPEPTPHGTSPRPARRRHSSATPGIERLLLALVLLYGVLWAADSYGWLGLLLALWLLPRLLRTLWRAGRR